MCDTTLPHILLETYFKVWAKFDNFLLHNKAYKNMKLLHKNKKVFLNGFLAPEHAPNLYKM